MNVGDEAEFEGEKIIIFDVVGSLMGVTGVAVLTHGDITR